jgi:hypothetical protein
MIGLNIKNYITICSATVSRGSTIVTMTAYGLDDRGVGVRVPGG